MSLTDLLKTILFLIMWKVGGSTDTQKLNQISQHIFPICNNTASRAPRCGSPCEIGKIGMSVPAPSFRQDCFPAWFVFAKFNRAQKFLTLNWGTIEIGQTLTIPSLTAIPSMGEVLFFTATHDCPSLARRRYVTTVQNILMWMRADISIPGNVEILFESIRKVRLAHDHVSYRLQEAAQLSPRKVKGHVEPIAKSRTLNKRIWTAFKMDLEEAFPPQALEYSSCYIKGLESYKYMNQFEYAMTLWTSAAVLNIPYFRSLMSKATEKDLEAVNHFWAVIGWMMGIDDRFNIALQPSLKVKKAYFARLVELYIVPSLYNIDIVSMSALELTSERTTPFPQKLFGLPNFVPLDSLLMGTLRFVLDVPYTNVYNVASEYGKTVINILEALTIGKSLPTWFQPMAIRMIEQVHHIWGKRSYGKCYRNFSCSNANVAKYLHYYYDGPAVNPNGIYFDCTVENEC